MSNACLKFLHGAAKQYCRSKIGVQWTHFFFLAAIALTTATCSVAIDVVDQKKTLTRYENESPRHHSVSKLNRKDQYLIFWCWEYRLLLNLSRKQWINKYGASQNGQSYSVSMENDELAFSWRAKQLLRSLRVAAIIFLKGQAFATILKPMCCQWLSTWRQSLLSWLLIIFEVVESKVRLAGSRSPWWDDTELKFTWADLHF